MEIITNTPIKFNYDPYNPTQIKKGRALVAENGWCAIDENGSLRPDVLMGKKWWDARAEELEAACTPFFSHLQNLMHADPRDVDTFLDYMAFKQQYPGTKVRWALVVAGEQGVGKDMAIDACWQEYGSQHIANVSPADIMGGFNDFLKCQLLRVSEVADLGDSNKWMFNEKFKVVVAGHPDRMLINQKYGLKYWMKMYHGTVLTTNHLDVGLYIPQGDRRYYVIKCADWAEMGFGTNAGPDAELVAKYFDALFSWLREVQPKYGANGYQLLGNYLFWCRDVSGFDFNVCPAPTAAKLETIEWNNENPDWFDDALMEYTNSLAALPDDLKMGLAAATDEGLPVLINVRKLRALVDDEKVAPRRLSVLLKGLGYQRARNPYSAEGKWHLTVDGKQRKESFWFKGTNKDAERVVEWLMKYGSQYVATVCDPF